MQHRTIVVVSAVLALLWGQQVRARQYFTTPQAAYVSLPHVATKQARNKGWGINSYSSFYSRSAHETFMQHGTDTKPLSALFFNAEDFRLSHIFQNCQVPINTKDYNPYMRVLRMQPRVEYTESGMLFGVSFDQSLGQGARWGVRVQASFKEAQLERKDKGWRDTRQTQDVTSGQVRHMQADGSSNFNSVSARVYRLDFLEALPQHVDGTTAVKYPTAGGKGITVFSNPLVPSGTESDDTIAGSLAYSPEGRVPRGAHLAVKQWRSAHAETEIDAALPTGLTGGDAGTTYEVVRGDDFSSLVDDNDDTAMSGATRAALQDKKAKYWVASTFNGTTFAMNDAAAAIKLGVVDALEQFNENTYEWLYDRGYKFESDKRIGLGDTQVDLYFDYEWSRSLACELFARVVAPTAVGNDIAGNPYHVHLGNRGHWEFGIGGHLDWAMLDNLRVSLGGDLNVVAKAKEKRPGVFVGSLIKNIGPTLTAHVSWQYANAHLLVSWVHPRHTNFAITLGYKFLFKESEEVGFTVSQTESWLGKKYNAGVYTKANDVSVDHKLAAANTAAYAHTFTMNCRYHLSEYVSVNAGSSYIFAGKNTPQESTMTCGCVVQF